MPYGPEAEAQALQSLRAGGFAQSFLNRQNTFIRRSSVSFSIWLAALQASGWAEPLMAMALFPLPSGIYTCKKNSDNKIRNSPVDNLIASR
jgi:hypothetical protein